MALKSIGNVSITNTYELFECLYFKVCNMLTSNLKT